MEKVSAVSWRTSGAGWENVQHYAQPTYEALSQVARDVYGIEYQLLFGNSVQKEKLERFIALL
jgi:hypothetical protein